MRLRQRRDFGRVASALTALLEAQSTKPLTHQLTEEPRPPLASATAGTEPALLLDVRGKLLNHGSVVPNADRVGQLQAAARNTAKAQVRPEGETTSISSRHSGADRYGLDHVQRR